MLVASTVSVWICLGTLGIRAGVTVSCIDGCDGGCTDGDIVGGFM